MTDAGLNPALPAGGGETGALMRAHDWRATALGDPSTWPPALHAALSICMGSPTAAAVLWGPQLCLLHNDAFRPFLSARHAEALGRPLAEVAPGAAQALADAAARVRATGEGVAAENRPMTLDFGDGPEETFWHHSLAPIRGATGAVEGVLFTAFDNTARARAERQHAGERERQRLMLRQMPGFVAMLAGPEHRFEYVNDAYVEIAGPRDFLGRTVREVFPEIAGQGFYELLDRVYASGEPFAARAMPIRLDRERGERFIDFLYEPVCDDRGAVTGIFVGGYDVTERVEAEAELRDSEQRHRALFDAIDEGFCIIEFIDGPDGPLSDYVHVQANAAYARHAGIPDVVGQKVREMVPDEAAGWVEIYGRVLATGEPVRFERELVATGHHLELSAFRVEPPGRRQVAVLFQDISARKRTEAALRESEAQFRAFAQAVPNHVWAGRPNGDLYWFNDQVYAYAGGEPGSLDGTAWTRIVHPDDLPAAGAAWEQALAAGEVYETEFRIRRGDGAYRWFLVRAEPVRAADGAVVNWVGTNTDIDNARRQAAELAELNATLEQQVQERTAELMAVEETLRQSQKMEAVGQLTGGLAHDFNNLLAGISGSLAMMQTRIAQGRIDDIERYMIGAQGAAKRAAALTHRLLAFSRRQTLEPKPTDVNRLMAGMEGLIRGTVGPQITVETVAKAGLWPTLVDPNQLENALLNLCINARDAMPDGGRITVETANRWLDDRAARERDLPPGQYVSMCVSDNGTGMSADVIERAFDPFFTTKPIGVGTGLGLSMIYGFARQSGGQVRIYSEVGAGTMVCLYLPRHHTQDAAEAEAPRPEPHRAETGETVLVIDDEPLLRMLVVDVLEELGYVGIEAADGPQGMAIIRSDARIDLLVTDVGLPNGMNGRQVADAARELRPGLKVLFVTGYAENAVLSHGHLDPGMQVVTKPFDVDALAARIKAMIAEP